MSNNVEKQEAERNNKKTQKEETLEQTLTNARFTGADELKKTIEELLGTTTGLEMDGPNVKWAETDKHPKIILSRTDDEGRTALTAMGRDRILKILNPKPESELSKLEEAFRNTENKN
jgi:hypothetical protein